MFDCVSMCVSVWMSGISSMGMHVKHDIVVVKIVFIVHAQLRTCAPRAYKALPDKLVAGKQNRCIQNSERIGKIIIAP